MAPTGMQNKPNVEIIVISWLPTVSGNGWPIFGDQPEQRPDSYLLVDRTGGPRESMVLDQAEILIEVYHKTSRESASDMANLIADNITGLLSDDSITKAVVNSVVYLNDTVAQYYRYQVYCDVFCRR